MHNMTVKFEENGTIAETQRHPEPQSSDTPTKGSNASSSWLRIPIPKRPPPDPNRRRVRHICQKVGHEGRDGRVVVRRSVIERFIDTVDGGWRNASEKCKAKIQLGKADKDHDGVIDEPELLSALGEGPEETNVLRKHSVSNILGIIKGSVEPDR